ncbi:hypothetical protein QFZ75_006531 [Streptomyces sp. V3I8]|nr:hypothetical protein [Streptomyces sp. V3I8]
MAREGIEVVLLKRDRFPRHHVGESLLPSLLPLLDILGVRDTVETHGFVRKRERSTAGAARSGFSASTNRDDRPPTASGSSAASSTTSSCTHAREQGADVREGVTVRRIFFEDGRPTTALWSEQENQL